MLNKLFKQNKVKDISFSNIFFKKFVIGLCLIVVLTIPILSVIAPFLEEHNRLLLDTKMSSLTLELVKIYDSKLDEHVKNEVAHNLLSQTSNDLLKNEFVSNAAIAFYDIDQQKIIIRSSQTPILENSDLFNIDSIETLSEDGLRSISLDPILLDFYKKHIEETVYVKGLYMLNDVIFPSELITVNDKYQIVDSVKTEIPSIATETVYDNWPILRMIGNEQDDITLNLISNFNFVVQEGDLNTQSKLIVEYPSITEKTNLDIQTIQFTINEHVYQIDCAYRVNFWEGAIGYVLLFELIAILLCAAFAFVNTKETLESRH